MVYSRIHLASPGTTYSIHQWMGSVNEPVVPWSLETLLFSSLLLDDLFGEGAQ